MEAVYRSVAGGLAGWVSACAYLYEVPLALCRVSYPLARDELIAEEKAYPTYKMESIISGYFTYTQYEI